MREWEGWKFSQGGDGEEGGVSEVLEDVVEEEEELEDDERKDY